MATFDLSARPRTTLGKKVKRLRREGIVPANIYGHNVESTAVEVAVLELRRVIREAGHTALVRINLDGERAPRTVLVRRIQRKATTGMPIHVDFQQVSMTERMTVRVPLRLVGEAPVIDEDPELVLIQNLDGIEVECLPGDIPQHVEADVSKMTAIDAQIHVGDIALPSTVTMLTDPALIVASVSRQSTEAEGVEEEPEVEEEAEPATEGQEASS